MTVKAAGAERYSIGGGRFFFNLGGHDGNAGVGLLDIGNLSDLSLNIAITQLPHFAFIASTLSRVKDLSLVTETGAGLTATADEIGAEVWNIISSGGGTTTVTQAASTETAEPATAPVLIEDRNIFPLKTNISALVIADSASANTYSTPGDYILRDPVTGQIEIVDGSTITTGQAILLDYLAAAVTKKRIVVGSDPVMQGSGRLEYQGQNGDNMTWVFQNCVITVEGDVALPAEGGFISAPITVDVLADKVVTPAEPFGYRLIGQV